MITKIPKIKDYGIFEDFSWDVGTQDFNRYNLFYGWNGSGKSTLSSLLSELTLDNQAQLHPLSKWNITTQRGQVMPNMVDGIPMNIYVFNKAFVEKNVFTENHVKGIVYLSEKKKDEKEKLQVIVDQFDKESQDLTKYDIELNGDKSAKKKKGLKDDNAAFLSEAAKSVKASFKIIDVDDNRLLNYDKTKLLTFIEQNKDLLLDKSSRLSVAQIETLSKSIKPQEKGILSEDELEPYAFEQLMEIYEAVVELCNTSITNKTIARLKDNPAIATWVYQGLKDFHGIDTELCEFCQQPLPTNRISDLNQHFSDEFERLQIALKEMIYKIELLKRYSSFPSPNTLFDEFAKNYQIASQNCKNAELEITQLLENWKLALQKKQNNPFTDVSDIDTPMIKRELYQKYGEEYTAILGYLRQHNAKLMNLQEEIDKAKSKLELHYVAQEVIKYSYFKNREREDELTRYIEKCKIVISSLQEKIVSLKTSLSNEVVAAQIFNEMLHKFIGRRELTLESQKEGGYIVKRYGTDEAKNLSEGERTAIGLVYFVAKLKENDNRIEDTIIVFDDPISSLDSNHLFSAKSFIKNHCENSKQLFVFTHNFWFFKIMRDWLGDKKEKVKGADGTTQKDKKGEDIKRKLASIYQFNIAVRDNKRFSSIQNAKKELTNYDSEYHYLFGKLQEYKKNRDLLSEDCYSLANVIRRICEAALTFKYPQIRTMKGLIYIAEVDDQIKDRLYDFLNKYSHLDRIEAHENLLENRMEEGLSVIDDVITLLQQELPEHYTNMCKTVEAS
ncbi:MAG: AAA family ATPase [Phocaeicola sp.]